MTETLATVAPAGSCPDWCAYKPCDPRDDIHISHSHTVPADPGHVCTHKAIQRPGGTAECDDPASPTWGVSAQLTASSGEVRGRLFHGIDELPEITLDAAAELGGALLALADTGQQPTT
jgi:hypothetical protein